MRDHQAGDGSVYVPPLQGPSKVFVMAMAHEQFGSGSVSGSSFFPLKGGVYPELIPRALNISENGRMTENYDSKRSENSSRGRTFAPKGYFLCSDRSVH